MRELEQILDLAPEPVVTQITTQNPREVVSQVKQNYNTVFQDVRDERYDDDFDTVRGQLKKIIDSTSTTIMDLSSIAGESERADHFTALAQLTKVLIDANNQLLHIFEMKKRYNKPTNGKAENTSPTIGVQGNAVFVGTTRDLKRAIEASMNGDDTGEAE